jgi:hypothetical protein
MKRRSNDAVKLTVVPLLAASFVAGCGDEEEQAYCVDSSDQVVENRYCDDEYNGIGGGGFFWFFAASGAHYGVGQRVAAGGDRIRASDRSALARRGGFGASSGDGPGRTFNRTSGSGGG